MPHSSAEATSKNIKWIDGLRGIASFSVICTHLARAFDLSLFSTLDGGSHTPRVAQYPFIRLLFQGKVGVAIFALLTGYVCALKPLRLARAGRQAEGLTAISKSALRRVPRLVLPATAALLIAWTICQLGGFTTATRCSSDWMRQSAVTPRATLWLEIQRLFHSFFATWSGGVMEYDDHQWALLPFLKGSFIVFLLVAALMYAHFNFRLLVYLSYLTYWWLNAHSDTETFGQQMIFGTLLVDLSIHPPYQEFLASRPRATSRVGMMLIVLGLYLASYPANGNSANWVTWSRQIEDLGHIIFPAWTDLAKRFSSLGVDLVAFGILNCAPAKQILSNSFFLWLGKHSFAVYLIHGTLLRSVLIWMVYGITGQPWNPPQHHEGEHVEMPWIQPRVTGAGFVIVVIIWILMVYGCAVLWMRHVDAWCARATQWLESRFNVKEGESEEWNEKDVVRPLLPL